MGGVTIRNYIGKEKELTAAEVRKLPEGTKVKVHSFSRRGEYRTLDMTVTIGTNKYLRAVNMYTGDIIEKPIKKETDRLCYTEVRT